MNKSWPKACTHHARWWHGLLTLAPVALEVHVAPLAIVHLLAAGSHLDAPRPHVQQQVEVAVKELHGEVICLVQALGSGLLGRLQSAVAEQQQPVGLRGAEVEGDGAGLLGVPLGQRDVGLWRLKGHGVEGCDALASEDQVSVDLHLGVAFFGQSRQLQLEVIVLVDDLQNNRTGKICKGKSRGSAFS